MAIDDREEARVGEDTTLWVLGTDRDPDDDLLTVVDVRAAHGEAWLEGRTIRYRAPSGLDSPAVVEHVVADGHGGEDTGRVEVTVHDTLQVEFLATPGEWIGPCPWIEWRGEAERYRLTLRQGRRTRVFDLQSDWFRPRVDECFEDGLLEWSVTAIVGDLSAEHVGPELRVDATPPDIDVAAIVATDAPVCGRPPSRSARSSPPTTWPAPSPKACPTACGAVTPSADPRPRPAWSLPSTTGPSSRPAARTRPRATVSASSWPSTSTGRRAAPGRASSPTDPPDAHLDGAVIGPGETPSVGNTTGCAFDPTAPIHLWWLLLVAGGLSRRRRRA